MNFSNKFKQTEHGMPCPIRRQDPTTTTLLDLIKKGVIRYASFERSPETFLFYDDMFVVMGSEVVVPATGAPNAGKTLQRR